MKLTLISLTALAAFVSATPLKRGNERAIVLIAFSDDALSAHNTNRANFGANPLTWGTSLASGAASFTSQCSWSLSSGNYGQNLYASTGSSATIQEAVENWMDQAPNYDYDHPGFNASTAAFTQVVWKASTTLGCGRSVCTTGNPFSGFNGPWTFIQCRYTPPGNVVGPGQYEANVGHPTGSQ